MSSTHPPKIVNIRYIFLLSALLLSLGINAQTSKLSSYVRRAVMQERVVQGRAKAAGKQHRVTPMTAFVRATDADVLRREGCRIYAQWDDIYIASVPMDKISSLARMPQIQRIEAGESCFLTNDTTAVITRARGLWNGSGVPAGLGVAGLKGKGVVVGVMDIGFDLTHPTFYSADMQEYRIKALWDQLDFTEGGQPVVGDRDTIYVGRQYVGKDALLAKQYAVDGLTQTHGTHTAGTAAGSGAPMLVGDGMPVYSGMAPEADLCLVANYAGDNKDLIPEDLRRLYTTATDMLGFKYIFDYAESVGKPCVINFSEGAHDDLYEHGLYQEVLSKLVGPGRIICASAGNEGGSDGTYMHKQKGVKSIGAFIAKWAVNYGYSVFRSTEPLKLSLSFYKDRKKKVEWNYDCAGIAQNPDSVYVDTISVDDNKFRVLLMTYPTCFDETLYATDFFIEDLHNKRLGYNIPISMQLNGETNDIEAFSAGLAFLKNGIDASLDDFDATHNVLFPASAKDIICVGATSHVISVINYVGNDVGRFFGDNGVRAFYSGVGPSINGLIKPDVMAPGTNIISSASSFWRESNPDTNGKAEDVTFSKYNNRSYPWDVFTGTSMACPVVAGIIAQWLQVCPTLSPDNIEDIFRNSCIHSDASLGYPSNEYGWGQIDASAGLSYICKEFVGIEEVRTDSCSEDGSGRAFDIYGRRILDTRNYRGIILTANRKFLKK